MGKLRVWQSRNAALSQGQDLLSDEVATLNATLRMRVEGRAQFE